MIWNFFAVIGISVSVIVTLVVASGVALYFTSTPVDKSSIRDDFFGN